MTELQSSSKKTPLGINRRDKQLRAACKPAFTKSRLTSCPRDLDHRQREAHPQFVFQINLHVMQAVLLKLHAAKVVNIGRVAFHLLQNKFYFCLRDDLLFVNANDAGFLPKFSRSTAPARPDAKPDVVDRQSRRRDDT